MRTLICLLALAGCAVPADAVPAGRTGSELADCSLRVSFGSYAMGIDRSAASKIEAQVARAKGTQASRIPWGREGEYSLCVATPTRRDALILFDALKPLVPSNPRGPVTIAVPGGPSFRSG